MQFLSADVVFPVHKAPVPNGILVLDEDGFVMDVIDPAIHQLPSEHIRNFEGFLTPGFVNSHCHLELSWSKGMIPEGNGLDAFVKNLETARHTVDSATTMQAIASAASEMKKAGIVAAGDISNSNLTASFKENSSLRFHTFCEVFASDPARAGIAFSKISDVQSCFRSLGKNYSSSITPHATYSVSAELLRLISGGLDECRLVSIHHQETPDETEFFLLGSGPIAHRRQLFNPGIAPFHSTGTRPLESIADMLGKDIKLLLVHNTFAASEDVDFALGFFTSVSWCLCPNANLYIEKSLPPIRLLRDKGCHIVLGTDSLASNHTLSILDELKTLSFHFPDVPLSEMLEWSTGNAAKYFDFKELGSFEKGKKPGVVWIKNVNLEQLALLPESTSEILIEA